MLQKSQEEPIISIIVPVYNTGPFLSVCIDSILTQTLAEIEVVLVDDGSTDESGTILDAYQQSDPRVRVIHQENQGMSAARNAGMKMARGKYLGFVDSDDFVAPEMFDLLCRRAEDAQADIVIGNMLLYYHDTCKTAGFRDEVLYYQLKNKVFTVAEQPAMMGCVAVWDRIFLRSFVERNEFVFPDGMIYEDALFTTETLLKAERIALVPDHLYYYRKNVGYSVTDNEVKGRKHKQDFLEIHRRCQELLREDGASDRVWKEYLDLFFRQAIMHQSNINDSGEYDAFFYKLAHLLDERIFALAQESKNPMIVDFAEALRGRKLLRSRALLNK